MLSSKRWSDTDWSEDNEAVVRPPQKRKSFCDHHTLGFALTRSYDENGNVVKEIDPNGNVKTFTYNNLNELTKKVLSDNVIELSRDIRGNVVQTKNIHSQIDYSYDLAGRLLSTQTRGLGAHADLPVAALGFSYDENGNRTAMSDPTGTSAYVFDRSDRLTSIANPRGEVYSFSFDIGNRPIELTRPGSRTIFSFDDSNFMTSIIHSGNAGTISSFGYQRDAIGNRTAITSLFGTRNLAYDANNQLISASNSERQDSFQSEIFQYDSIYNRAQDQLGSFTYDSKSQRLDEDYRYFYYYDKNGNLTKKQAKDGFPNSEVTNFSYSSENQLIAFQVYEPGNTSPVKEVSYLFDALGRRVEKKVVDHRAPNDPTKTFTRRYVYDGQEILLEYDGSNRLLARYTHSGLRTDDVLAVDITPAGADAKLARATGSYQYLKDAQGTITDTADNQGNLLQHYVYSAFGILLGIQDAQANDVTPAPLLATSFSYTGRELDSESGYYYYRARYYDPGTGRFLQKDPEPGKLGLPSTVINGYAYAANNPLNLTDPSGKSILDALWNTVKFVAMVVISPAAFIIDPAWTLGNLMRTFNLSIPGQALNWIFTGAFWGGRFAYERSFHGKTTVENSMFSFLHGFTMGPVSFLPVGATDPLRYHELGHQLQYERGGFFKGWSYLLNGINAQWLDSVFGPDRGGYDHPWECEAGTLSHDQPSFGLNYYPDAGYVCPAR